MKIIELAKEDDHQRFVLDFKPEEVINGISSRIICALEKLNDGNITELAIIPEDLFLEEQE